MKKIYNLVLTVLTILLLLFISFTKLNASAHWVDMSAYQGFIDVVCSYGPMVLLCLFAFGSILISKFLFIIVLILLVVFTVCMFAPDWIASVFGGSSSAMFGLFLRV